ncbi:MAG: methyl-accepting chemotaxis protein [Gammaproteobacteria bacterium]
MKFELSVRNQLIGLSLLTVLSIATVGGVAIRGQQRQAATVAQLDTAFAGLRNHMESDMMHDALRADVLAALHAAWTGDKAARATIESDLGEHLTNFTERVREIQTLALSAGTQQAVAQVVPALNAYGAAARSIVDLAFTDRAAAEQQFGSFVESFEKLEGEMSALSGLIEKDAAAAQAASAATMAAARTWMYAILVAAGALSALLGWLVLRGVTRPIDALRAAIEAITRDDSASERLQGFRAEFNAVQGVFNALLDKLDARRRAEQQRAEESERIRQALEQSSANVMMADANGAVVFANRSARSMFEAAAPDLRSDLPAFDPARIVGGSIDQFHRNPQHQRSLLANMTGTHRAEVKVGKRTFRIVANPVSNADGSRMGTVVEWTDLTEQRDAERDIERIIADASAGRLDSRLDAARYDGFMRQLAGGVNQMLDAIVGPLNTAAQCVARIAAGDVPAPIEAEYGGDFARLRDNLNTCIDAVGRLVGDAGTLAAAAQRGELGARVDAARHEGDFRRIVEGMNGTLDAITGPLNAAASCVDRIARGDIPEPISADYRGEFRTLRDNLNTCIGAVRALVQDSSDLAAAAQRGDLAVRADTARHQGDFRRVIEGINGTMDGIVGPLSAAKRVVEALARGNLGERVDGEYRGEFAELRDAVNTCSSNLEDLVGRIRGASASIATSAGEIAKGNQDLSQRTEQQASSLEETASSMEQLTGTVKQNADNARQADQLAADARTQAERGGAVVSSAVEAMGEINRASKKIADIIGVIDEIAFQTNLLALNAAVEAARAGEQGRGFAVVAAEVRNLAQRSAGAAKEIKALINDSVQKVEEGSRLVDESGTVLGTIVGAVKRVSDIIAEISAASHEQASGIEQVNKAVTMMDQATQQNAALVEQAAAASESMDEQAGEMARLIEFFGGGAAPAAAQPEVAVERRKAGRPWTKREAAPARIQAPAVRVAAAGGDDGDWSEF